MNVRPRGGREWGNDLAEEKQVGEGKLIVCFTPTVACVRTCIDTIAMTLYYLWYMSKSRTTTP